MRAAAYLSGGLCLVLPPLVPPYRCVLDIHARKAMTHQPDTKNLADYVQVDAETHYDSVRYLSPQRLASIGYQVQYLDRHFRRSRVLEVGVGTGVAAGFLRQAGCEVATLDIDAKLAPTVLGSVTEIPVDDNAYESFMCCQVLEHLPWSEARKALRELRRIAVRGGVISVPTVRACVAIRFFPFRKNPRSLVVPLPWLGSRRLHVPDQHEWELGCGVSVKEFVAEIDAAGFRILEQRQLVENPYHHFFVVAGKESRIG